MVELKHLRQLALKAMVGTQRSIFERLEHDLNQTMSVTSLVEGTASLQDLKLLSTKAKGDFFELLVKQYLIHHWRCETVYLWSEVTADIRTYLGLGTQDMGIDIVAKRGHEWLAVQAKWRQPGRHGQRLCLPWAQLSTFYALVERTGPPQGWAKRIVATTARSVRRMGAKDARDVSICAQTWLNLTPSKWYKLLEIEEHRMSDEVKTVEEGMKEENKNEDKTKEDLATLRERRLQRFSVGDK